MAMFISPRINVGEKAAGGTLSIYATDARTVMVPLWQNPELSEADDGSGRISNPLPVDNNGVLSSPVFYDSVEYPEAFYAISDANGAEIRSGLMHPVKADDGGNPSPEWNYGDDLWGYQVIEGTDAIAALEINAGWPYYGRPLFLAGVGNADPSGGIIVYATTGTPDGVLSFQSSSPGLVWKARERLIKASYLIGKGIAEPYNWIDLNYEGQYDVLLDADVNHTLVRLGRDGLNNLYGFSHDVILAPGSTAKVRITKGNWDSFPGVYVTPSPNIVIDNTFYAGNVEAYSQILPDDSITPRLGNASYAPNEGITLNTGDSDGPGSLAWGNPHYISNNKFYNSAKGILSPRFEWDRKIVVNSWGVDIENNSARIFVLSCGKIRNSGGIYFDYSLDIDINSVYQLSGAYEITRSTVYFGRWVSYGKTYARIYNMRVSDTMIKLGLGDLYLKDGVDMKNTHIIGSKTKDYSSNLVQQRMFLGNNTSVTGCALGGCYVGFEGDVSKDGQTVVYKNIHFDGNCCLNAYDDTSGSGCVYLKMPDTNIPSVQEYIFENFTIKNPKAMCFDTESFFVVLDAAPSIATNVALKGHIEIAGYYDYGVGGFISSTPTWKTGGVPVGPRSQPGANLLPVETFPVQGKNIATNVNGTIILQGTLNASGYLTELCVSAWGDPLKYVAINETNNLSAFFTADPWQNGQYLPSKTMVRAYGVNLTDWRAALYRVRE